MRCGLEGTDCALEHVVPALGGRCTKSRTIGSEAVPYEWACRCPACHGAEKLTVTAKGKMLLWYCQRCPEERQPDVTAALAALLPACFGAGSASARPGIRDSDVIALTLSAMPPMSMKLALLELAGMGTQEALDKLGVRREHRSRVISGRTGGAPKRVHRRR